MKKFEIHDAEYYQKYGDLPNEGWRTLPEKLSWATGQFMMEKDEFRGILYAVLSANYIERYGFDDGFFMVDKGPDNCCATEEDNNRTNDLLYKCIHNNKQWSYYLPKWYSKLSGKSVEEVLAENKRIDQEELEEQNRSK
jgi:hypothetical protein